MSALYVFALTGQPAPAFRDHEHRIEFIEVAGIHAAVERVAAAPAVSEAALRTQHDIVVKVFAAVDAVLPARFGTIVDHEELEQLVSMRQASIRDALALVSGRAQMTVRTFTAERREAPREGGGQGATAATGTGYLEQRRQESRAAPVTGPASAVAAAVRDLIVSARVDRGQGRVEWAMYHLVDRGMVARYKQTVAPFESAAVVVSGPWPPFAFVPDLWV